MKNIFQIVPGIFSNWRKILEFYFPFLASYWDTITPCQINDKVLVLGRYYMDFRSKYYYPGRFSRGGIPLYQVSPGIEIFHPTTICQYALGVFDFLLDGNYTNEELIQRYFAQVNWLVEHKKKLTHGYGWYLNLDIPEYKLKAPWISAMTQGEAISILCRAYLLSKDISYLDCAESALGPFKYHVGEGGLLNFFKGVRIFEEYPSQKPNVVLNGYIFAVFGLYDLFLTNSNPIAERLYNISIESLSKIINYFDLNYWSQYSLYYYPNLFPASYAYHNIQIEQMKALYFISGNEIFNDYSNKWKNYNSNFLYKNKALLKKIIVSFQGRNNPK